MEVVYRYAQGNLALLLGMVAELTALPVDVIVARGQTITAARDATAKIGIVMAADPDPVGNGLIESLARPGGNITGLTTQAFELEARHLSLLQQVIPTLERVAVLSTGSKTPANTEQLERRTAAARALKLDLIEFSISSADELESVFAKMSEARAGAVLIGCTAWFVDAKVLAALALKHKLASIANLQEFARSGALMTYGVSFADLHRRSAIFVDRILKGAQPADLAVEQPTAFEMGINLKTAKALGLTIPPLVLAQADEVIE